MTAVSISDLAKALIALEAERHALYAKARHVALRQEELIATFERDITLLSNDHHQIIAQLAACEDTSKLLALGRL